MIYQSENCPIYVLFFHSNAMFRALAHEGKELDISTHIEKANVVQWFREIFLYVTPSRMSSAVRSFAVTDHCNSKTVGREHTRMER